MDSKVLFENRRAVNFFDPAAPLDDAILKNIIDLAVLAPSAFNLQPWKIIAVKSKEAKAKLQPLAFNQPKITEAPVTLILVGNLEGYQPDNPVWKEMEAGLGPEAVKGYQQMAHQLYGATEIRRYKFAESNAGLLAMSLMYAAQHYGVDSHPMSGVDFDGIKQAFGLSENQTVVMLIALGYFDRSKSLYPRGNRSGYDQLVQEV